VLRRCRIEETEEERAAGTSRGTNGGWKTSSTAKGEGRSHRRIRSVGGQTGTTRLPSTLKKKGCRKGGGEVPGIRGNGERFQQGEEDSATSRSEERAISNKKKKEDERAIVARRREEVEGEAPPGWQCPPQSRTCVPCCQP